MRNYNITVLGLSETRWTQSGQMRLTTGEMVLYSGCEEMNAPHIEGVAFMLSQEAQRALITWEAAGPWIITASLRTKMRKIALNIVQCYAPTNDKDEEVKDHFCNRLQTILDKLKEKDMTVLMGDFNAKIGADNRGYEEVMGRYGIGEMNENGEMFADLCASNRLVIGVSVFPHRRIHKATWISPDHRSENQIDHVCIGQMFRRSLLDVRVYRGADAASDHHLVLARIKMKLKRVWVTRSTRPCYNVGFVKDREVLDRFRLSLDNRYQVLQNLLEDESTDLQNQWQLTKETWINACEDVLGRRKLQQREWISQQTLQKVQERRERKGVLNNSRTRAGKTAAQEKYKEAHKAVRKSIREDEKRFIQGLAQEAEGAAAKGDN